MFLILVHSWLFRPNSTIVQKGVQTVEGFDKVRKTLYQQIVLRGQSTNTFENYFRRIAIISLHFKRLPKKISDDEINEYLTSLALASNSRFRSSFNLNNSKTFVMKC